MQRELLLHDARRLLPRNWADCRFLTCSVLPVRSACNLSCPFCFSRSSISALGRDSSALQTLDVGSYYRFARDRGATRLVVTGGGEPLLRPDLTVHLVREGRKVFDEVTCFTNATRLTRELSRRLADAGLSYLCWSRHAESDADNRRLMGAGAPALEEVVEAAASLPLRATCVLTRGWVDDTSKIWSYIHELGSFGVREFTFKHTYVAYEHSVFAGSDADEWARAHQIDFDPFESQGTEVATLPWGPKIRRIKEMKVCFYREPTPDWELQNGIGRSTNLLSNGEIYGSLEDRRSLLYRLTA